jgi:hypothetical protein
LLERRLRWHWLSRRLLDSRRRKSCGRWLNCRRRLLLLLVLLLLWRVAVWLRVRSVWLLVKVVLVLIVVVSATVERVWVAVEP